jgi:hypothetical protein
VADASSTAPPRGAAQGDLRIPLSAAHRAWRGRFDGPELAILLGFIALSIWVLALDLRQVVLHDRSWTGTDGMFVTDQMTYLAWIRDSSHHLLVSNLFELQHTPADFFQPLVVISGALVSLGLAPWVAMLLWKPIAVGGLVLATRAFVHGTVPDVWGRRAALGLALFFVGPGAFVADKILHTNAAASLRWSAITFDLSLGFWSWGYSFGLIALAAAVAALVAYARARSKGRHRWVAPLLGALASSLHPWQGAILILVLLGAEAIAWRSHESPRLRPLLLCVSATALPLLYFVILNRSDPAWKLAQVSAHSAFPLWMVALTLAPLLLPAAFAYRARPQDFLARATRLWPLAALIIFGLSETKLSAAPTHALLGISIPLAILAVEGVRSVRLWERRTVRQVVIVTLIASAILPGTWYELTTARTAVAPGPLRAQATGPVFLDPGERSALNYLARDPRPGGVLSRFYLGTVVPAFTGRHTFVGNFYYSPDFPHRVGVADQLFAGGLAPRAARAVVQQIGARFLLADCRSAPDLQRSLAPIVSSVHRFGCASVFVVR